MLFIFLKIQKIKVFLLPALFLSVFIHHPAWLLILLSDTLTKIAFGWQLKLNILQPISIYVSVEIY
jgi:hypothetical protein